MAIETNEFIYEYLNATRYNALGTYSTDAAIHLEQEIFDGVLYSALKDVFQDLHLTLCQCDTYNLYSEILPIQVKDSEMEYYLVYDRHMTIINRIFNAIYLQEEDATGHDVWKLAYELFMESTILDDNHMCSTYFGMNKLALGDYESKELWFKEEDNFMCYVQMAYVMGHEIGHWVYSISNDEKGSKNLNLKDELSFTFQNIKDMVVEIFREFLETFKDKEYYQLILEGNKAINDRIIEECFADAFAISVVLKLVNEFDDEDLSQLGFGDRDPDSVTLEAMLVLFLNLQILAMHKMTVSSESFEIQTTIRLSFFRQYVQYYYEDMEDEFKNLLNVTVQRYEKKITNVILEAFSELEDRADLLEEKLSEWDSKELDVSLFMEL